MPDNILITQGTGTTVATDEIGGVQYQRIKLKMGADGSADMDLDSGQQSMVNSLPVVIASDQSALPITVTSITTLNTIVGGGIASNAADSGNPLKVGGKFTSVAPTLDDGDRGDIQLDVNGNVKVTLATGIAGENWTVNRMFTENNYTYSRKTADGQVGSAAGYVHTITIAPTTATPTAGLITVYDSLTETGTIIFSEWIFATTPGHTVTIDCNYATGLYVGYTTVTDVSVTVSYRANV